MALNAAMYSAKDKRAGTPQDFFDWVDVAFGGFTVDVCADAGNAKLERYYDIEANGLVQSWRGETAWCNPEYGDGAINWLRKGRFEAMKNQATTVNLIPSRTDTRAWQECVFGEAGRLLNSKFHPESRVLWLESSLLTVGIYFHDARIPFDMTEDADGAGAPFPSAVVIFDPPRRVLRTKKHRFLNRCMPKLSPEYAGRALLTDGRPS